MHGRAESAAPNLIAPFERFKRRIIFLSKAFSHLKDARVRRREEEVGEVEREGNGDADIGD
jgi:hypothetical protein